ncbi:alpha/beta hydrolase [Kutzneria viridogrisea]|uniref:Serine aminopeptidase S33 domain-containing protein n=2 Tax=Kutzneria TaxID=43356 RepID=W5W8V1_9PSEU|nr:alpha/beta fold hydrolase [Kutzneria albida]AHH97140.1 hypothetical protein KALB_3776 [Kutzneria albida DSM 43870]MBA8931889.1 pimeloyl-ACP methyl ester carboxylesterase [Kutzneria viridogrisea]
MPPSPRTPQLTEWAPAEDRQVTAVALLLHGGRSHSHGAANRRRLTYLRMVPFARDLHRAGGGQGLAVWLLSYRYRGWNAPDLDPVRDARWALDRLHERHPGVPAVLVGHSMGGRTAFRVADDPAVRGVCALAPWTEPEEPVEALAGRQLLIAHGDRERWTDPALSYQYALRARRIAEVARFDVHGDGHAMLRRAPEWTRLVTGFTLGCLGFEPMPPVITNAMCEPAPNGLRVPLKGAVR